MARCDIIVLGGSAGAIEGTQELVGAFPADFAAAIFVVVHLSPDCPSMLPKILQRAGQLPAKHPVDGEPIRPGQIFVAPPDRHLTIEDGVIRVARGPRENRHRPAIDPLFRTAARVYDSRVIGTILSGQLDDGAAGLRAIRSRGGIAIVQDPEDAPAKQMPSAALEYGGADYVLPITQIGPKLVDLVMNCESTAMKKAKGKARPNTQSRRDDAEVNLDVSRPDEGQGVPSPFSCPECGGVLWELKDDGMTRFRCRVGHAYTMTSLANDQTDGVENALWASMRALEEKAALATRMSESTSDSRMAERLREQAQADRDYAETIRRLLFEDEVERKESKSAD